jgi:hypothetical protein
MNGTQFDMVDATTVTVQVEHECQSCEQMIATTVSTELLDVFGADGDSISVFDAETWNWPVFEMDWVCHACGRTYSYSGPFDVDVFANTGFHSWVGQIAGCRACIVVREDSDTDEYDVFEPIDTL